MTPAAADPLSARVRLSRRLARLFRIERAGRLQRCPAATARHLIERRAALIALLIAAEQRQPVAAADGAPALDAALRELAREIGHCRPPAERRAADLAGELRLRRGVAAASGLGRSRGGRLLGSG
jgi:hypothetical protein